MKTATNKTSNTLATLMFIQKQRLAHIQKISSKLTKLEEGSIISIIKTLMNCAQNMISLRKRKTKMAKLSARLPS